ncbi:DUF7837 family putative zinc-binding protein [Halovenus marina]|jgi:hypothetical protein|uniref:DUF7837 family putative zinc-binding protein n=1 Tax=Halovenus marina TaxID=3396621 RepID=UPI003F574F4F
MKVHDSELGRCPRCDCAVPAEELFVDYVAPDGERATFATCPNCRVIVSTE